MVRPGQPSTQDAYAFIDAAEFVWHQRFELVPGVETPGEHDIRMLFELAGVPSDLSGKTALDVGTSNGGAAFLMERLGAERVVAVDIYSTKWFGFTALRDFLRSRVEYAQGTVYDLSRLVQGNVFDIVLFWGVLYHLRHPLLALDEVRAALAPNGEVSIETAVSDDGLGPVGGLPIAQFHRRDDLGGDPSNWFSPTVACLKDWCASSGLTPTALEVFGEGAAKRCMLVAWPSEGPPEYTQISYEVALRAEPLSTRGDWGGE
jgi:tRNA (mo5U34)-methyltransferase